MARKRRQRIIWPRFLTFLAVCGLLIGGLIYGGVKLLAPAADLAMEKMYPRTFQSYIEKYSKEYGMDENLIYAVCKIASTWSLSSPYIVSSALHPVLHCTDTVAVLTL